MLWDYTSAAWVCVAVLGVLLFVCLSMCEAEVCGSHKNAKCEDWSLGAYQAYHCRYLRGGTAGHVGTGGDRRAWLQHGCCVPMDCQCPISGRQDWWYGRCQDYLIEYQ